MKLGVRHLTDATPTPTPTPTPAKLVEALPAPVAPPVVADPPKYVAPPAPVYVPPAPVAPPVYSGIVCKDGYAWPGTTRQGACRGHGGIRS